MSKNNSETSEIKTMKRSLTNTHIQLIALGGTIGTGLFLGVGNSIELAGFLPFSFNESTRRIDTF